MVTRNSLRDREQYRVGAAHDLEDDQVNLITLDVSYKKIPH